MNITIKNILYKVIYLINPRKWNRFRKIILKTYENMKIKKYNIEQLIKKLKTHDLINHYKSFNQN